MDTSFKYVESNLNDLSNELLLETWSPLSEFALLWNYSGLVSMLSVNSFSGVDIYGSMTD